MTTTDNLPAARLFSALYFADAERPRAGHVLIIGDTPTARDATAHAFELSGDSFSTYRMSVGRTGSPITSIAIEIETTGRTVRYFGDCRYIRTRVTFVGDCEPDTHAGGWIEV